MNRKYTAEHIAYIETNIEGRSYPELTAMFNERFGMEIKPSAMISFASRRGLRNGRDCRFNTGYEPTQFKKGNAPWNKGKKGLVCGGIETRFKKGQTPKNYRPVGSERVNVYGYVEVKVADPGMWKLKQVVIWEAANGSIPAGHCLLFADGNKLNVKLDNLLLISRRQLAVINKRGLIANSAELTKTGVVIADIYLKIGERKKR